MFTYMCSLECKAIMEGVTNAVFQSSNTNLARASEGSESLEMRMDAAEPSSSSSSQRLQESVDIFEEKSDIFEDVELSEGRDTLPDDLDEIGRRMSERAYPCNCHKYCNGSASHRNVDHTSNGDLEQGGKCKSMWSRTQHSKRLKMIIPHGDDEEEVTLMYSQHERIPMKDFSAEIRATLDVGNFVQQATLLLDVSIASLEAIIDLILAKMLHDDEKAADISREAKLALFTHDSVHVLAKTIQGTSTSEGGGFDYDQSWVCALCSLPSLQRRYVGIARLRTPANLGRTSQEVRFVILVLAPLREKGTKNALETARTFATLLADIDCRQMLLEVKTEEEFKRTLTEHAKELAIQQSHPSRLRGNSRPSVTNAMDMFGSVGHNWFPGRGVYYDLRRRLPNYISDFTDGLVGTKTLHKLVSTTLFLYFACLLPSIAFGVLNAKNTKGSIDVQRVITSQTIGGAFFAMFGGQPLIVLLTTAPLALYIKIIYTICLDLHFDFFTMYCLVGLWNSFFLTIYSLTDASRLIKWSTRSTEEIFALFISIAFTADAFKDLMHNFKMNYYEDACNNATQLPTASSVTSSVECLKENSLLYAILMFGTLWLGVTLYNFTKSPFLDVSKREALADYSLPVAVLTMSFVGSFIFRDIELTKFQYEPQNLFSFLELKKVDIPMIVIAMGLGFCLSLLFFIDQNISSAMVNRPANKLKKGAAYHLDLFIVALINGFLSLFGLPWVHAALPHSPLHVRALADVEERVDQGHVNHIIVRVRETRLSALISHIMIGLSLLMLPSPLQLIPTPVLYGLFLYVGYTSLDGNQLFERVVLLITEQAAYPPNHYVRRVPQRKMHVFTFLQVVQLAVLCGFGFSPWPYLKMVFPILLLSFIPIRHKLIPRVINIKFLDALDRSH
ncbi:Sodium bicarbonate transporter-like protein 11 [Holothuria leucospilota]|uniref:Sodium bicarbonate transporter-like protein 11 n=1 Tax=Holothuria leucospilota TaxID=206669 RepID=A0A9Q1C949_HOLLE|nr:Sodium bicarbonate transporter-like protein 11 [Holothuria leucospilota]